MSAEDFVKVSRNSSRFFTRFASDRLFLRHRTAAPSAGPIIRLPVQSASPRSQRAAPLLLQLRPSSVICISTQMRPAWVICVKIPQITKYNLWESSWLSWLLNTAEPKATLLLRSLLSHMSNRVPRAPGGMWPNTPKWKTKAVMTICNINLIGLTVSPGLGAHSNYLWLCFNLIALIAYSKWRPCHLPPLLHRTSNGTSCISHEHSQICK